MFEENVQYYSLTAYKEKHEHCYLRVSIRVHFNTVSCVSAGEVTGAQRRERAALI